MVGVPWGLAFRDFQCRDRHRFMGSVVLWGAQWSSPGHDRACPEGSRAMLLRHNERWIASRRIGSSPVPVMVGEFTPVALCQIALRGLVGPRCIHKRAASHLDLERARPVQRICMCKDAAALNRMPFAEHPCLPAAAVEPERSHLDFFRGTGMGQTSNSNPSVVIRRWRSLSCRPFARLATMLFQHAHVAHDHAAVGGLAHVVAGEQADLHGGERFRLDAGAAVGFDLRGAHHATGLAVDAEVDRHAGDGPRVAQRDQLRRGLPTQQQQTSPT